MSALKNKKKRSENFNKQEIDVLISEVQNRKAILFGDFGPRLTHNDKKRAWDCVAEMVNAVSHAHRSVAELKIKYKVLKCKTKKKASNNYTYMMGTGSGPSNYQPLTTVEEAMVRKVIGRESIEGFGGPDTSRHLLRPPSRPHIPSEPQATSSCSLSAPNTHVPARSGLSVNPPSHKVSVARSYNHEPVTHRTPVNLAISSCPISRRLSADRSTIIVSPRPATAPSVHPQSSTSSYNHEPGTHRTPVNLPVSRRLSADRSTIIVSPRTATAPSVHLSPSIISNTPERPRYRRTVLTQRRILPAASPSLSPVNPNYNIDSSPHHREPSTSPRNSLPASPHHSFREAISEFSNSPTSQSPQTSIPASPPPTAKKRKPTLKQQLVENSKSNMNYNKSISECLQQIVEMKRSDNINKEIYRKRKLELLEENNHLKKTKMGLIPLIVVQDTP